MKGQGSGNRCIVSRPSDPPFAGPRLRPIKRPWGVSCSLWEVYGLVLREERRGRVGEVATDAFEFAVLHRAFSYIFSFN